MVKESEEKEGWQNLANNRRKDGKGDLGKKKRGRRHMGMNKFILMKPD